jgi:excisionase family DNA binding protein
MCEADEPGGGWSPRSAAPACPTREPYAETTQTDYGGCLARSGYSSCSSSTTAPAAAGSAARKGCAVAAHPSANAATTSPSYLRAAEAADILHVSPKTVSRWATEGRLPFLKTLGGHRRYPEAEIRALADGLRQEATT